MKNRVNSQLIGILPIKIVRLPYRQSKQIYLIINKNLKNALPKLQAMIRSYDDDAPKIILEPEIRIADDNRN